MTKTAKNVKTKVDPSQKEDWWTFCDNYLSIAELACLEMVHQKYDRWWFQNKGGIRGLKFYPYNLYISAIYNLKHSIEIFLKYFLIAIEEAVPDKTHNIEDVLELFAKKYKVEEYNKVIKQAFLENRESRYSLSVADMESEFHEEWFQNIAKISLKYFQCEDIKPFIGNFNLKDVLNDGFRYPKNRLEVELEYSKILSKIDKSHVQSVLDDIYELRNAFNSLRFLIEVYHDIK